MDLEFHMTREASELWWRVKGTFYMVAARKNEEEAKAETRDNPSNLVKLMHCHENIRGKTGSRDSITSL